MKVEREEKYTCVGIELEVFNDRVDRDFPATDQICARVYESIAARFQFLQGWVVLLQATDLDHFLKISLLLVPLLLNFSSLAYVDHRICRSSG